MGTLMMTGALNLVRNDDEKKTGIAKDTNIKEEQK